MPKSLREVGERLWNGHGLSAGPCLEKCPFFPRRILFEVIVHVNMWNELSMRTTPIVEKVGAQRAGRVTKQQISSKVKSGRPTSITFSLIAVPSMLRWPSPGSPRRVILTLLPRVVVYCDNWKILHCRLRQWNKIVYISCLLSGRGCLKLLRVL